MESRLTAHISENSRGTQSVTQTHCGEEKRQKDNGHDGEDEDGFVVRLCDGSKLFLFD